MLRRTGDVAGMRARGWVGQEARMLRRRVKKLRLSAACRKAKAEQTSRNHPKPLGTSRHATTDAASGIVPQPANGGMEMKHGE